MKNTILVWVALLFCATDIWAQKNDSVLNDQTIEIIQTYKPQVRQAVKPNFSSELPPRDTATPRYQYSLPQQALSYSYNAPSLRPLALDKDTASLSFPNYLKLGGGNLSTIFLDAGIGQFKNERYESAIHVHHLQQQGTYKYQRTSFSGLEATGSLRTQNLRYHGSLDVLRNSYALYGGFVDTGSAAPMFTYSGATVAVGVTNEIQHFSDIDYNSLYKFGYYHRKGISESSFDGAINVSKPLDEHFKVTLSAIWGIAYLSYSSGGSANNNLLQLAPRLYYQQNGFTSYVGVRPAIARGNTGYLLPDIYLSYLIPHTPLGFFIGWEGTLLQNTFRQLTTYNPYLQAGYAMHPTKQDELYGGVKVGINNNFSFTGKVSHRNYQNLPMFLNNWVGENTFYLLHDNVKALSVEASIRYDLASTFSLKLSGAYYDYYQSTYAHVWQEPSFRFNADFAFRPIDDLKITAYCSLLDGLYALDGLNQTTYTPTIFDLGMGGEYQIVSRLGAFVNINNLLNQKYQRWYNYPSYGFNIYGGLRFKF